MGEVFHHESMGKWGAVQALAHHTHHILANNGNEESLLSEVFADEAWTSIESSNIVSIVRALVHSLKLHQNGIDPDLVGSHLLHAGGAMALKLNGFDNSTIQKFGCWMSDTWQMYIHHQIAHIHQGVAAKMSTSIPFINISFIEPAAQT